MAGTPHGEETNCEGVQALIKVPPENVDPLVPNDPSNPHDFELLLEEDPLTGEQRARVSVGANRCERIDVFGDGGAPKTDFDTIFAALRVDVCDPEPDPAEDCRAPEPNSLADVLNNEIAHGYLLWIASDNHNLIKFFRDEGGLTDRQAVFVRDGFVFDLDRQSGDFHFEAPKPTPSPFMIVGTESGDDHAQVDPLTPLFPSVTFDQWASVPTGTMRISPDEIDDFQVGGARGRVVPEPGSEMDRVFCGHDGAFDSPDSIRTFFPAGRYPAEVDTGRTTSATGRAGCSSEG